MDEKRIIEFVILYCKDELTVSDAAELDLWLKESERHRVLFATYLDKYRRTRKVGFYDSIDDSRAWKLIAGRIKHDNMVRVSSRFRRYFSYAALLLLFVSVAIYFFVRDRSEEWNAGGVSPGLPMAVLQLSDGREVFLSKDSIASLVEVNGSVIQGSKEGGIHYLPNEETGDRVFNTIRVPRGGEYYLQLPDGTRVWLNSESELTYEVSTGEGTREVQLVGEAYFEVARDECRPFQVVSKHSKIRVLGTKFNVSAYEDETDVVTTLVDGLVAVSTNKDSLVLKPGEQARSGKSGIDLRRVDASIYTAWKSGVFEFEEMSLEQITRQLERWYGVTFVYFGEDVKQITFTGAASRHGDLKVILGMIERLSRVKFTRSKDRILVTKQ